MKKCSECEHCKTIAEKNGISGTLFTMVCIKNPDKALIVDIHTGHINQAEWKDLECVHEVIGE